MHQPKKRMRVAAFDRLLTQATPEKYPLLALRVAKVQNKDWNDGPLNPTKGNILNSSLFKTTHLCPRNCLYPQSTGRETCRCGGQQWDFDSRTATRICIKCGMVEDAVHDNVAQIMDNVWKGTAQAKYRSAYSYKPSNHMWQWICRVQGKESVHITDEIWKKIRHELATRRIQDSSLLTPRYMREILHFLKVPMLYANVNTIIRELTGKSPLSLSADDEQNIMAMFSDVTVIFADLQKEGKITRKNLLSYSFMLHKICITLGITGEQGIADLVQLPKHEDKLCSQENDWMLIMARLEELR